MLPLQLSRFGMTWDNAGKNSFPAPFAWSA